MTEFDKYFQVGNTGFEPREAPGKRGRPPIDVRTVSNPVNKAPALQRMKPNITRDGGQFDLELVAKATLIDGIAYQSVEKKLQMIVNSGWRYQGNPDKPETLEYLKKRFLVFQRATKPPLPWDMLLVDTLSDFIQFANAFWVVGWVPKGNKIANGLDAVPAGKKGLIGAYYRVAPQYLRATVDRETNSHLGWEFRPPGGGGKVIPLDLEDVVHFNRRVPASRILGYPEMAAAIEDIRGLRDMEDVINKLVFKHANPLIQEEVPDTTGMGYGDQRVVDQAKAALANSAYDGIIVTPPGYKFTSIGAESKALRAEGYQNYAKHRVYTDLGLSDSLMGEGGAVTMGAADAQRENVTMETEFLQLLFALNLNNKVLYELLLEGGFDPYNNEEDRVHIEFLPSKDARRKEQLHNLQLWQGNAIYMGEMRAALEQEPGDTPDALYADRVQLPAQWARGGWIIPSGPSSTFEPNDPNAGSRQPRGGAQAPAKQTSPKPREAALITEEEEAEDAAEETTPPEPITQVIVPDDEPLARFLSNCEAMGEELIAALDEEGLEDFHPKIVYETTKGALAEFIDGDKLAQAQEAVDISYELLEKHLDGVTDVEEAYHTVLSNVDTLKSLVIATLEG